MSTKLAFMGKVGEVSGFDSEIDATAVLILETLLAAYSRVAIQINPDEVPIVLRPTEVKIDNIMCGRHFFLLEKGATHEMFRVKLVQRDDTEAKSNGNGTYRHTVVTTSLIHHKIMLATPSTVVDEQGTKLDEILKGASPQVSHREAFDNFDLYYLDMNESSDWKGPSSDSFFMFMVQTMIGTSEKWRFLTFFARPPVPANDTYAIRVYLMNLMANNLSPEPFFQSKFDQSAVTMSPDDNNFMKNLENGEVEPSPTVTEDLEPYVLPEINREHWGNISTEEFPIVQSVVFVSNQWYVLSPWSQHYAGLLYLYINVVRAALQINNYTIEGLKTLRSEPDYETVLGLDSQTELIIITRHYNKKSTQNITTVAIQHSCIARLIFGSNPSWHQQYLEIKADGGKAPTISSPGFGCLDVTVCREARDSMPNNFWKNFTNGAKRNGEFHEMIGRTAEELDSILFADSVFFRSFIGRNATYAEAVRHWIETVGRMKLETTMRKAKEGAALTEAEIIIVSRRVADIRDVAMSQIEKAYSKALTPYIEKVINQLISTTMLTVPGQNREKDSTNYIRILQAGHQFEGFIMNAQKGDRKDTTKLIFSVYRSRFLNINPEKFYRQVDGGIYLMCLRRDVEPESARAVITRSMMSEIDDEKKQQAYDAITYSAFCPYGYLAHSLYKILEFSGNHLDFFPASKVDATSREGTRVMGPHNCSVSKTTLNEKAGDGSTLSASAVQYFIDENERGREDKILYLSCVKELWSKYIFTWSYIHSLLEFQVEKKERPATKQGRKHHDDMDGLWTVQHNNERKFALVLAKFLRTERPIDLNKPFDPNWTPNIYELMPYDRFANLSPLSARDYRNVSETMGGKYRNVYRNFYTNCDEAYKSERLWCMQQADRLSSSGLIQEEELTNLDMVHGYLLVQDFVFQEQASTYLNWKQYITMSASVIYARRGINEKITFLSGAIVSACTGEPIDPKKVPVETQHFKKKQTMVTFDDKEEDVLSLFNNRNKVSLTVFANIANVPIYNEGFGLGNNIMVSTLNEALSPANNFVYMLARSLHVRFPGKTYEFDLVYGKPWVARSAGLNLYTGAEFRRVGGQVIVPQMPELERNMFANGGPSVMVAARSVDERPATAFPQQQNVNVVAEMRNLIENSREVVDGKVQQKYLPKLMRSEELAKIASKIGRNMLTWLPPDSGRTSAKQTLKATIISYRTQVTPFITVPGDQQEVIQAVTHTGLDIEAYIAGLRRH